MSVGISVIILAKNEARYIGATLEMVFRQDPRTAFEVIVIDSGSRDDTLAIASRYPVTIMRIPSSQFDHGATRNLGAQKARGDVVVFLNADATPCNESWLAALVEGVAGDETIAGVYSRSCPRPECNPLRTWEIEHAYGRQKRVHRISDPAGYRRMKSAEQRMLAAFESVSCAIRRDFLLRNPFADMEFGEDLEWGKRMLEQGYAIVFEPRSRVFHSHNIYRSFSATFRNSFDEAKLNRGLFGIRIREHIPRLAGHITYKLRRDMAHIVSLDKSVFYRAGWLCYSPLIRLAELLGILAGAHNRCLPRALQSAFSLAHRVAGN
jgi:rhamnosyltransferase